MEPHRIPTIFEMVEEQAARHPHEAPPEAGTRKLKRTRKVSARTSRRAAHPPPRRKPARRKPR